MGIQTRSSVKSDSSNCFGPCFYPQRECFGPIVYSDPGIDSRRCTREERSVQALSLLGTRDTAIINTSTQPRTKIFAGVRGTRTRPRCTSAFTPSARVRGPWMHSRLVLLRSLAMVNVVLLLPLRSLLPRGSHFSLLRAMCTNGSDTLILSLSLCSSPSRPLSRCIEVWILVGLAGASIAASLSADNIGVDRSSCSCRNHCLVRELFINVAYDSIVRK